MASQPQQQPQKNRKKGPKLTKDGKITVFDPEDTAYGIRELIDLIRYIPDGQDVFFGAEMIKKTLHSMQLSIHDIMVDGVEKRKLAAKTIQHLVAEIADYQRRIQSLKGHIRHLRFELGEIQDTCHYFLADDLDLQQYQHILDEVPKSPIEGDDAEEEHINLTDDASSSAASDEPVPALPAADTSSQPASSQSTGEIRHSGSTDEQRSANDTDEEASPDDDELHQNFDQNDTLVSDEVQDDFMPSAFTNPDGNYQAQADSLNNLTDEVFDPDRFDDENGVLHGQTFDDVDIVAINEEQTPEPQARQANNTPTKDEAPGLQEREHDDDHLAGRL